MVCSLSPKTRSVAFHDYYRDLADSAGAQYFPRRVRREAEGGGVGHIVRAHEFLEKAVRHMCAVDDCISHASLMQHCSSWPRRIAIADTDIGLSSRA
jgi:hypothetical protein